MSDIIRYIVDNNYFKNKKIFTLYIFNDILAIIIIQITYAIIYISSYIFAFNHLL
jgi:hypothetical protein